MIGMQSDENRTRENCGYLSNKLFFPQLFFFCTEPLFYWIFRFQTASRKFCWEKVNTIKRFQRRFLQQLRSVLRKSFFNLRCQQCNNNDRFILLQRSRKEDQIQIILTIFATLPQKTFFRIFISTQQQKGTKYSTRFHYYYLSISMCQVLRFRN